MTPPHEHRSAGLLGSFLSLAGAQVIATAAGFLFWLGAARLATPSALGITAAAIAAATLLSKLLTMGLGTLLIVELPRRTAVEARGLLSRSLVLLTLLGVGGGVICDALLEELGDVRGLNEPLQRVVVDPMNAVMFIGLIAATTISTVLDQAVLGVNRASVQVHRNTIAALGRFPLLLVLAVTGHEGPASLLACWVLPLLLSLVVAVVQLRLVGAWSIGDHPGVMRLWRAALAHHMLNLALAAGPLLVPVIAAATLTTVGNAHFTVAWMVATFIFIPPYMLATALFSSTAGQGEAAFATSVRRTLPLSFGLSFALCCGVWIFGGLGLHAFGSEYAGGSTHVLWLLAPAGLWMVVKDHLVAQFRIQDRMGVATWLALVSVTLEAAGAAIGGYLGGAQGLALGWLLSALVQLVLGIRPVLGLLRLARSGSRVADEVVAGARPVVISNALVPDPVEGTQVMARKVTEHLVGSHGARVLVPPGRPAGDGLPEEPLFTEGYVPVRAMLAVLRQRPSAVVVLPDGGIDFRKLVQAVLIALAACRQAQLVAVQRQRHMPRAIARVVRPWVRIVAGNEADREALAASGFEADLLTPPVDPGRISTADPVAARAGLGLPADKRVHLHVGHGKRGRNLLSLAPLATGDQHLVLVLSPFGQIEEGSLPAGPNLTVVQARVDVGLYYRAADVYVFPTYDPSHVIAFPMSIGEALANGLPVVARRSAMTQRWNGDARVSLVDTDEELVRDACTAMPLTQAQEAVPGQPSPFVTCGDACDLGRAGSTLPLEA